MSELLIELFSEEIPARMQPQAAADLKRLVCEGLTAAGLGIGEAEAFATPRRLALVVEGVPARSPDTRTERNGPRVGAPAQAIQGFLKAAGLARIEDADVVRDGKKGDYYVARINKPGRDTPGIVAELVPAVIAKFPWPKSMRTGSGRLRWVRPLHSIICLYDGQVVPFEVEGIRSGNVTRGHRFLGPDPLEVKGFADYRKKLRSKKVLLDSAERAALIGEEARTVAAAAKLRLVEDEGLTAENAGLTEWPGVLMGSFDKEFLAVPAECLVSSMRTHQKCFSVKDTRGRLASKFLLVTNLTARDGGEAIIAGNEKVIRARLSDAKFFWEQDLRRKLEPMHFELKSITFHENLGTQWDRMERITELARQIAGAVDAEADLAGRAAQLCKADLVSGMVGEFPELQGLMGRYYAEAEHMNPKIARAIEEHYKPKGHTDTVPTEPVSIAVALADKLDTLVGFWAIGEKPTGSGDPYQLRRAALGVIRIVLENDLRVPLLGVISRSLELHIRQGLNMADGGEAGTDETLRETLWSARCAVELADRLAIDGSRREVFLSTASRVFAGALRFFADRLNVHLRDKGARHDLIDAVFSLGGQDDLALIVRRVEALGEFLETDDGANLLAGVKRATNILRIEEKKDKTRYDGAIDPDLLDAPEEHALSVAIIKTTKDAEAAIGVESFAGAMAALAELRAPVDAFFDKVIVNADDPKLRVNRLRLLNQIREATRQVADLTKVEG